MKPHVKIHIEGHIFKGSTEVYEKKIKVIAATNLCWENVRVNEASPEIPAYKLIEIYYF
jgi:hypothetical protein